MTELNHGSLFSGIGGFDLAAEWAGWTNVFHCEINPFGQKILKHYWPESELIEDITKFDFTKYAGKIDIISGGFPCQPFSLAGKRKGTEDDRHLWPEMLRVIREVRPTWVVGENVFGIINWDGGLVFDQVQSDLETEGYEVQPYVLPAVSVNAPHRRDRVFFVAYTGRLRQAKRQEQPMGTDELCKERATSDSYSLRHEGRSEQPRTNQSEKRSLDSDTEGDRNGVRCETEGSCRITSDPGCFRQAKRQEQPMGINELCEEWDAANPDNNGQHKCDSENEIDTGKGGEYAQRDISEGIGYGNTTDTSSNGRLQDYRKGKSRLTNENGEIGNWQDFPTQPPICSGDDGFSDRLDGITFPKWRNESIKAFGNAVVPQVVYQIFKAINLFHHD